MTENQNQIEYQLHLDEISGIVNTSNCKFFIHYAVGFDGIYAGFGEDLG